MEKEPGIRPQLREDIGGVNKKVDKEKPGIVDENVRPQLAEDIAENVSHPEDIEAKD